MNWRFWRRRPPLRVTLYVKAYCDMLRVHPDMETAMCSVCGGVVGIYPSGQAVMKKHGEGNVDLVCNRCGLPSQNAVLAPGAQSEPEQSFWRG